MKERANGPSMLRAQPMMMSRGLPLNKSQEQAVLSISHGEIVENQYESFGEGLENESVWEFKEWMGKDKRRKTKKKKRAKKARSWAAVYRDALILAKVTDFWRSLKVQGRKGFSLKEKLKQTKVFLKGWSKNMVPNIEQKISKAKDKIEELDVIGENRQLSNEEILDKKNHFLELWNNLKIQQRMWRQKSRKT
ncbi:hypothetical protein SLEP1_g54851 [Rubroshorea leprosula]|uniref:Uncharacterized protein n=1 Tax=Rubroshorea leprosula TaxID=152421 RepID=A0AAV5MDP5_9ROSI|nr:hypothetical protein SLEP1_g54851 [Rubroshorea leprosula]